MLRELSLQEYMEIAQAEGLLMKSLGGDSIAIDGIHASRPATDHRVWLTISTQQPDRKNDILVPSGAVLSNYIHNPLFLWNHGKSYPLEDSVLGATLRVDRYPDKLVALVEYASLTNNPLPDKIWELESKGFLPAQSVGLRPLANITLDEETGIRTIGTWELLEISKVAIPMNPNAVRSK